MSFIQENIIKLNIGLDKEYKLIQISDVHAMTSTDKDTDKAKEEALKAEDLWYRQRTWFARKANEHYDESHMIPSKECLNKLIEYINEEEPNAAILSGDIIDYYSESNYSLLKDSISKIRCPYIFTIGNHEAPVEKFEEITKSPIGFSKLDFGSFKIISLDNSLKMVSNDSLLLFKKELEEEKPIIVVIHIPVSTKYNHDEMAKYDPYFIIDENETDDITKEFINICKNNLNIKAILCGHTHGHSETYFMEDKLECCASSGLIGLVNKIIIK